MKTMKLISKWIVVGVLGLFMTMCHSYAEANGPDVIIDMDMCNDLDDVIAYALAAELHNQKKLTIRGVYSSTRGNVCLSDAPFLVLPMSR